MQQALYTYNLRQLFVKKKITPVVFTFCIVRVKHPKNDTWKSILLFSFTDPSLIISLVIKKNGIQVRLVISALNVHRRNSQLQWKLQQFHVLELVVSKLVNNVYVKSIVHYNVIHHWITPGPLDLHVYVTLKSLNIQI